MSSEALYIDKSVEYEKIVANGSGQEEGPHRQDDRVPLQVQVHEIGRAAHARDFLGKDAGHADEQVDEGAAAEEVVELVLELTLQHREQRERVEKDSEG